MYWYGLALRDHDIDILRSRPKVFYNRYIGVEYLSRKKVLGTLLKRMEYLFGDEFAIAPKAFNFPEEEYFLEEHMKRNPNSVYIGKPSKGSGGEGIFLMKR